MRRPWTPRLVRAAGIYAVAAALEPELAAVADGRKLGVVPVVQRRPLTEDEERDLRARRVLMRGAVGAAWPGLTPDEAERLTAAWPQHWTYAWRQQ